MSLAERAAFGVEQRLDEMRRVVRADHDRRRLPVGHPGRDHEVREIGDVVVMQMRQEDVIHFRRVDVGRHNLIGGSVAAVEQVVAVANGDQNAGIVPVGIRHRGACAEHDYAHFVLPCRRAAKVSPAISAVAAAAPATSVQMPFATAPAGIIMATPLATNKARRAGSSGRAK